MQLHSDDLNLGPFDVPAKKDTVLSRFEGPGSTSVGNLVCWEISLISESDYGSLLNSASLQS